VIGLHVSVCSSGSAVGGEVMTLSFDGVSVVLIKIARTTEYFH
jgi:hypothetical protein